MTMEDETAGKNVMCLLTDPEDTPLGKSMYLPQNTGPQHLQQIVNQLLNNVSYKLFLQSSFKFWIQALEFNNLKLQDS